MLKPNTTEAVGLYVSGLSCREIALRLGVSQVGVLRLLRKNKIILRSKSEATSPCENLGVNADNAHFTTPIHPLQPIPAERMNKRRQPFESFSPSDHPTPTQIVGNLAIFVIDQDLWDHHSILARNQWSNIDGTYTLTRAAQYLPSGLSHLFLWKDEYAKPCVQTMIAHRNAQNPSVCSARECTIADVPLHEAKAFYDAHHLQGSCGSGATFGLYFNNQLVSCMTFNIPGMCRGLPGHHMLQRFASIGSVPGAASRLLAHYRKTNSGPILSYSDERYAPGGRLYQTLGFTRTEFAGPDYRYWRDGRWFAKNTKQKSDLRGEAVTRSVDILPSDTEYTLAAKLGYKRVYDLGKITWRLA